LKRQTNADEAARVLTSELDCPNNQ